MLPDKPLFFRSTIQWSFRVLLLAVILGLFLFFLSTDFHKDLIFNLNDNKLVNNNHKNFTFQENPVQETSVQATQVQENPVQETPVQDFIQPPLTQLNLTGKPVDPVTLYPKWLKPLQDLSNYSTNLLTQWLAPGGEPCKDSVTDDIYVHGLDDIYNLEKKKNSDIVLATGVIHEYVIQTLDKFGNKRCLGGDYFETDISGDYWKSRPPVKDLGNGNYSFALQVHPDFTGVYNFTVILLFRHYQGLKFSPERFAVDKLLRVVSISFVNGNSSSGNSNAVNLVLPELKKCRKRDFRRDVWSGRWTRPEKFDVCLISNDGRFRCPKYSYPCKKPWCDGPLGSVESNGWVYSTHCSFKLFDSKSAWKCLNNRWLFFWGDSNHCDTIRNMLNFVLGYEIATVPRLFDMNITNPKNPLQSFRVTNVFNGHYNHTGNYQGLNSLYNDGYREYLKGFFSGEVVPDTLVMNSGLHDGVYWPNLRRFIKGAHDAAEFWAGVIDGVRKRKVVAPEVVYRTTVATGGYARRLVFNPHKMEAFNGVFVDKLREFGVIDYVVDHFDMTYPWHFDNRCNDGVHYGRAPAKARWRDGGIGHQYFVDLMLCHVLLNVLCSR
uniref:uncharacterized protein LOC122592351 n=1 Tax=Erigeron canadensis TaxID=72917 RepID=UPI001CB923B0|nr:uncharacterized protein LOC122592351 [Erigeron canadensis]